MPNCWRTWLKTKIAGRSSRRRRYKLRIFDDRVGVLPSIIAPARKVRLRALQHEAVSAVREVIVVTEINRSLHARLNQHLILRASNDQIIFDRYVSRLSRSRADIKVNALAIVVTRIVVDLVSHVVRHDATSLGMVINQVIDDFVVLTGDVVGEDSVRAVVMNYVVSNDILARSERRRAGIY